MKKPEITVKNKIRIYKILAVVLVLAIMLVTKIFINRPQIDMRVIVTVMGIDCTDTGVKATANVIAPVAKNESISQHMIESGGKTVHEAIDGFSTASGTLVELSQCGMIVFGQSALDHGILNEVKAFFSEGVVSAGIILIAADRMEASEFMEMTNMMGEEASNGVNSFIQYFEKSLYMPSLTMMEFLSHSVTESRASLMPVIELGEKEAETPSGGGLGGDTGGGGSSGGGSGTTCGSGGNETYIKNLSKAVILRDGVKTAMLSQKQTKGYIWNDPRSKKGSLNIEKVKIGDSEYSDLFASVYSKKCGTKVYFENGLPHVKLSVKVKGLIKDKSKISPDINSGKYSEIDLYRAISAAGADIIEDEVRECTDALKRYETDFMTLIYKFHRHCAQEIKEYDCRADSDFYRDVQFVYDIVCEIK